MNTIVEVGAFEGTQTFKIAHAEPDAQMFAFEPHLANFCKLHAQSKHFPNLTILPFAVDIGDNLEPLFEYPDGQSTLQPPWGKITTQYRLVWTMRLETFMHLYSIEQIDYLHIDAPYREAMILESLGALADRVKSGRVTVYPSEIFDTAGEVVTFLTEHGFTAITRHQPNGPEKPEFTFERSHG
jgi:FkbM family methyltransferase